MWLYQWFDVFLRDIITTASTWLGEIFAVGKCDIMSVAHCEICK